jgi:hypothetical protein
MCTSKQEMMFKRKLFKLLNFLTLHIEIRRAVLHLDPYPDPATQIDADP